MVSKIVKISLILSFVCSIALAETEKETQIFGHESDPDTHYHLRGDFIDKFHNPAPGVTMTADIRLREIYGWNTNLLNNNNGKLHFQRYRMRWGTKIELDENVSLNSKLAYEFRTWDEPQSKPQSTDFDEIIFDELNIQIKNLFDMPLTATVGRQNLNYGKGWIILDGTPLDGSRTGFFDAAKLTYDWCETKTKIDMIYFDQSASADKWLKPINDRDKALTEQDERGVIVYLTNNFYKDTQLESYFIYRNDNPVDYVPNFPLAWSKKADIYTFGGAIQSKVNDNWDYRAEMAIQRGKKDGRDLKALGTLDTLTYSFNDKHNNKLSVEYEYLSGDDRGTSDDEAFDPLWGEWARFSDVYPYMITNEGAIAEFTNMHRLALSHSVDLDCCWNLKTFYSLFWADENTLTGAPFNDGGHKFRGQMVSAWLSFQCCKQLKAYYMFDYFMPGNFYDDSHRGGATFMRFNLEYLF